VLDLGTGSGILAIAAAKLGVGKVLALDVAPQACLAARRNVRLNRSAVLPSGRLILSGLLAEQSASFLQLLVAEGFRIVRERIEESWLTFLVASR